VFIILCLGIFFGFPHQKNDENSKFQILRKSLLEERKAAQMEHTLTRFLLSLQEDSARFFEDRGHIALVDGIEVLLRDGRRFVLLGVKLHPKANTEDVSGFKKRFQEKLVRIRVDRQVSQHAMMYLGSIDLASAGLEAGIYMVNDEQALTEAIMNAYRLSEQSAQSGLRGGWSW